MLQCKIYGLKSDEKVRSIKYKVRAKKEGSQHSSKKVINNKLGFIAS
jgi:hypothetical protein